MTCPDSPTQDASRVAARRWTRRPWFIGTIIFVLAASGRLLRLIPHPSTRTIATPPAAPAGESEWIGKRVVLKSSRSGGSWDGPSVSRRGCSVIFRVERAEGPSLWLKAEGAGQHGWATIEEIVLLDQAFEFLTVRTQESPKAAFAFALRAAVLIDRGDMERAIADCDKAIRTRSKLSGSRPVAKAPIGRASAHFRWIRDHGDIGVAEHRMALAELDRMQSRRAWAEGP